MSQTADTLKRNRPALVNWLGYLILALLLALPAAVLTVRAGAWQQGLMLYALSCLGAALLLSLAILAMLLPRFAPWRKTIATRALFTLPGTALLLVLLAPQISGFALRFGAPEYCALAVCGAVVGVVTTGSACSLINTLVMAPLFAPTEEAASAWP